MSAPETVKTSKKNLRLPLLILTVLLISSIGFNFLLLNRHKAVLVITQHRTDTLMVANNSLQESVKHKIAELETYKGKNKTLDRLITQGTEKLSKLGAEALALQEEAKTDEKKQAALERKIKELDKTTNQFLAQIDALVVRNKILRKKNDSLSVDIAQTNEEKTALQEKVNKAAALRIEYLNIATLKKKMLSKKMEQTSSAFMVSEVRTCFRVMENPLAPVGTHVITLRILDSRGKVLGNVVTGSGSFKNEAGEDIQYTASKTISYTGAKSEQCLDYSVPEKDNLSAGTYNAEVYLDGALNTSGTFVLK